MRESLLDKLFGFSTYGIAYKEKKSETYIVKFPTYRYSYADPFVFENEGKAAIFVELMDYHYGWGTIGAFEIKGGKLTSVKEIIRENNHMSFPNVFKYNEELYMIPETYSANEVHLYRCIDFPYKWEMVAVILEGVRLVDTSVWVAEDYTYLISYDLDINSARCFILDWKSLKMREFFPKGDFCRERAGGTFYYEDGRIKRVIQDCTRVYGDFVKIYTVNSINQEEFTEELVKTIKVDDLKFEVKRNSFMHIHQYSVSSNYEAVDFFYRRVYWNKIIRSVIRRLLHPNRFFN